MKNHHIPMWDLCIARTPKRTWKLQQHIVASGSASALKENALNVFGERLINAASILSMQEELSRTLSLITRQTPQTRAMKTKPLGQERLSSIVIHTRINIAYPELFTCKKPINYYLTVFQTISRYSHKHRLTRYAN